MNTKYSKKEMWMYSFGALGQGMVYATMSGFISDYYINVLGLSAWFGFWLMLLARIWDAINDPLMGMIVDRKTTRWGKYKPYILFTAVPIAILTFLMYFCPDSLRANTGATMVYCSVIYVLWGMTYTVSDVPFWSVPNAIAPNYKDRGQLISMARTLNGVGSALPTILFAVLGFVLPIFMTQSSTDDFDRVKYILIAIIASVLGMIPFVISYFHINERIVIQPKPRKKGEPGSLSRLLHTKPLMLVIAMGILASGRYLMSAAAPHVARYCFLTDSTDPAAISKQTSLVFTILQVCSAVGTFGTMLLLPILIKKFEYKKIVIVTCLGGFIASIFTTLIGWFTQNIYICIPFLLIQCIPLGALNTLSYTMIGDCIDYMEWKTGHRDTALSSACQSFVNKLSNALATAGVCLMYIIAHIDTQNIVNSNTAVSTTITTHQSFLMFSLISIIPGICLLFCAIPMFFYNLTGETKKQMFAELQERRRKDGIITE